jgi:hypothetical protein
MHWRLAAAGRVIALVLGIGSPYPPMMDYQFPKVTKSPFPCRFPAKPPIITARPSKTHDSPWFLLRLTTRKNFTLSFPVRQGNGFAAAGVGGSQPPQRDSGATAVPEAATQGEVRLPENQLGWSTSSPPHLSPNSSTPLVNDSPG